MKFCLNCGERLNDDASFCGFCGAAQANASAGAPVQDGGYANNGVPASPEYAPQAAKKRFSTAKFWVIIGVCVVVIALGVTLFASGAYVSLMPNSRLKLGVAENRLVDAALDSYFDARKDSVSYDAELSANIDVASGADSETAMYANLINDLTIEMGINASPDGSLLGISASYRNNELLDATIVADSDKLGLYIPVADSNYYTIDIDALMALISEYAGETSVSSQSFSGLYENTVIDEKAFRKDVKAILKILSGLSTDDNTEIESGEDISLFIDDEDITGAVYSISPDKDDYTTVLLALVDHFESGDSYIYDNLLKPIIVEYITLYSYADDSDSLIANPLSYVRDNIEMIADELDRADVTIRICMKGSEIVSQQVIIGKDMTIGYDRLTVKKVEHSMLYLYADSELEYYVDIKDEVSGHEHDLSIGLYASEYSNYYSSDDSLSCIFEIDATFNDRQDTPLLLCCGKYKLSVRGMRVATLEISSRKGGAEYVLSVNKSFLDALSSDITGAEVKLVLTEGASVHAPNVTPVDLSNKSYDEIMEILEDAAQELTMVLMQLDIG